MKRVVCTFGGAAYDETIGRTYAKAQPYGATEFRCYDDRWLMGTPYYALNAWVFNAIGENGVVEGFGWCNWKAYIIQQEMKRLSTGDLVMYLDADTYPIAPLDPLFAGVRDGFMLFEEQGCSNRRFTRADCWAAMGGEVKYNDNDYYEHFHEAVIPADQRHACGRFQVFEKGSWQVEQFLQEWLTYSINPMCQLRHSSNVLHDLPEFGRNSCEQSVLSNLAARYKIPLHRTPDQNGWPHAEFGGVPGDSYLQIFHQEYCTGDRTDLSGSKYFNVVPR